MKLIKRSALAGILGGVFAISGYAQDVSDELKAPADVAAAPADAEKTASGLTFKVLKKGEGTEKPRSFDTVTVHYTGWTTDGKMFDSSVKRGQPASFPLNQVIKGWTEGLQLMVAGEKRRFWIPADLAYGENPGGGRPGGLLVFDVELISIKKGAEPPKTPENLTAPADAQKTESGLAYKILKEGSGEKTAREFDSVKMNFTLWDTDGKLLQTSEGQPEPPVAPISALRLGGWGEAAQLMKVGEKRRLWITKELGFGENPPAGVPNGVVIELEILEIVEGVEPPKAPEDVAAAPETAEKTESGLASRVLTKGTGTRKPKATDTVSVHYTGWETDGKMFDSSVTRGEPTEFPLNQVIKGWTEGVGLMVEGEKRRFWIPADLAYGPKQEGSGRPGGLLVFDVELLKIVTPE